MWKLVQEVATKLASKMEKRGHEPGLSLLARKSKEMDYPLNYPEKDIRLPFNLRVQQDLC